MTGSPTSRLVVLRGNSGSGKSTTAKALRERLGRGTAWVEQDHLRRILLREHDLPGGVNIGLIDLNARYALDHGYDVVLEGIMHAGRYGDMLRRLTDDHLGTTLHYYFDIPFEETAVRHATRELAGEFSVEAMREWYRERDLLDGVKQTVIGPDSTLDQTVGQILTDLGVETAGAVPL
ncbi:adenylate kinase family enzyme [Kribbella rubisoli]|uniref:Adenylate kinase family enzyme n=1 Tax=Kribbella rubisoli TaxID=3075929 RepID=A0A4Q7X8E1_9ACTN|nr:kinase [Kribbella rubisoli]RZU19334.1 adenylate kinase family enzyme [Kribbella rubisoli]